MQGKDVKYFGANMTHGYNDGQDAKNATISVQDFNRVRRRLQEGNTYQDLRKGFASEKLALHASSKNRVKHWDNTVYGQRRAKLAARDKRQEAEEAIKLLEDKEYEEENRRRRDAVINHAKMLQYHGKDYVKSFHSQLRLKQVMEERDMQLTYKAEQDKLRSKHIPRLPPINMIFDKDDKDRKLVEESKKKTIEAAKVQYEQMLDFQKKKEDARKEEIEDGKETVRKDEEYCKERRALSDKRRKEALDLRSEILDMIEQANQFQIKEKEKDTEYDRRSKLWVKHKEKVMRRKKDVENERFQEFLRVRHLMGERQAALLFKKIEEDDQRIENAVKGAEEKAKRVAAEKAAKTALELNLIKEHREGEMRGTEKAMLQQKEDDRKLMEEYKQKALDIEAENLRKKHDVRRKGLEQQEHHKNQMRAHATEKEHEKRVEFGQKKVIHQEIQNEIAEFDDYLNAITKEDWGSDAGKTNNMDLYHKFAKDFKSSINHPAYTLSNGYPGGEAPWTVNAALRAQYHVNTGERLGFAPREASRRNSEQSLDGGTPEPLLACLTSSS